VEVVTVGEWPWKVGDVTTSAAWRRSKSHNELALTIGQGGQRHRLYGTTIRFIVGCSRHAGHMEDHVCTSRKQKE
jgi:hypothetical protein